MFILKILYGSVDDKKLWHPNPFLQMSASDQHAINLSSGYQYRPHPMHNIN